MNLSRLSMLAALMPLAVGCGQPSPELEGLTVARQGLEAGAVFNPLAPGCAPFGSDRFNLVAGETHRTRLEMVGCPAAGLSLLFLDTAIGGTGPKFNTRLKPFAFRPTGDCHGEELCWYVEDAASGQPVRSGSQWADPAYATFPSPPAGASWNVVVTRAATSRGPQAVSFASVGSLAY